MTKTTFRIEGTVVMMDFWPTPDEDAERIKRTVELSLDKLFAAKSDITVTVEDDADLHPVRFSRKQINFLRFAIREKMIDYWQGESIDLQNTINKAVGFFKETNDEDVN